MREIGQFFLLVALIAALVVLAAALVGCQTTPIRVPIDQSACAARLCGPYGCRLDSPPLHLLGCS
jgi:hypothetical protein